MTRRNISIVARAISFWLLFEGLLFGLRTTSFGLPGWAIAITVGGGMSLVMVLVTRLYLKSEERLEMSSLGMALSTGSLPRLLISLPAGMAFFGCLYLVYLGLGPVSIEWVDQPDFLNATVASFFALLALGTMEEIAFRGYFMRKLDQAIGVRAAIYVTSVAFGLYHGLTIGSLTGPAVWGLLYGALAYWSRGLAVPIGFHVGANLTQALFSQKQRWASGLWMFAIGDEALLTVDQISAGLQIVLLLIGVVLVEVYVRRARAGKQVSTLGK